MILKTIKYLSKSNEKRKKIKLSAYKY